MPDTPRENLPNPSGPRSASSYLSAELGALGAFLRSRSPLAANPTTVSSPHTSDGWAVKPPARVQIETDLAKRASSEAAFRTTLLAHPTATVARALEAYDARLLDSVTVHVHVETPTALHIVLPMLSDGVSDELDDALLDLVAGGASGEEGTHTAPYHC